MFHNVPISTAVAQIQIQFLSQTQTQTLWDKTQTSFNCIFTSWETPLTVSVIIFFTTDDQPSIPVVALLIELNARLCSLEFCFGQQTWQMVNCQLVSPCLPCSELCGSGARGDHHAALPHRVALREGREGRWHWSEWASPAVSNAFSVAFGESPLFCLFVNMFWAWVTEWSWESENVAWPICHTWGPFPRRFAPTYLSSPDSALQVLLLALFLLSNWPEYSHEDHQNENFAKESKWFPAPGLSGPCIDLHKNIAPVHQRLCVCMSWSCDTMDAGALITWPSYSCGPRR